MFAKLCATLGAACAALGLLTMPAFAADKPLPIVFVHGNGDTAGLWITTLWRFESNGYARELLHAVDLRYPVARSADDKMAVFNGETIPARTWPAKDNRVSVVELTY